MHIPSIIMLIHACIQEGDTLYLLTRVNNEWYEGENTRTGAIGQFPTNFVNVIEPLP